MVLLKESATGVSFTVKVHPRARKDAITGTVGDALKLALDALRDTDASVRAQAVGVIGFLKLEEAVPALTAATTDRDSHVRRGAVSALAFNALERQLTARMRDLEEQARKPALPPTDQDLINALGEETARVLGQARESALELRAKAERMGHTLHHQGANLEAEMKELSGRPGEGSGWGEGER